MGEYIPLANNVGVTVGNAAIPAEGPKTVPLVLDFTMQPAWKVDPLALYQQKSISLIQCVYFDNALNPAPVTLDIPGTSQTIICPANAQGYFPILSPKANTLNFSSPGNVAVRVELINVPMPASVWFPNAEGAASFLFDNTGALETADQGLAPLIDPAKGLKVQGISGGGGGHPEVLLASYEGTATGGNFGFTVSDMSWTNIITRAELWVSPDAYAGAAGWQDCSLHVYNSGGYYQGRGGVYLPGAAPATPTPSPIRVFEYAGLLQVQKDWLYGGAQLDLPNLAGGKAWGNIWGYSFNPNA